MGAWYIREETSEVQKRWETLDDLIAYFVMKVSMMRKCEYINGSAVQNGSAVENRVIQQ